VTTRRRLGVLVSGSGSNLQALIDACGAADYPAEIAVVVCNVAGARAVDRAREAGIPVELLDHKAHPERAAFDDAVIQALRAHRVELVCLAGFMRLVGAAFLDAFPGKVINIHPSLLPAFPGLHGARQALAHGAKITGCTVHFVDAGLDSGPIIVQAAVPVLPTDDEASLAARILAEEHRAYPAAVRWLCEDRLEIAGRTVRVRGGVPVATGGALRSPGSTA
jgi:phosphoribosylglycinamide formyltransferase-1